MDGASVSDAGQLSVEPPSICAAVTVTVPALVVAERSTVMSLHTAVGVCTSFTVTVNWHVVVFAGDEASVATYVWVVVPNGNNAPGASPAVCATVTPEQLSTADGFKNETFAPHSSTSLPTVIFDGQFVNVGATLSTIVMVFVQVATFPVLSAT